MQIAATCWAADHDIATANTDDFVAIGELLDRLAPRSGACGLSIAVLTERHCRRSSRDGYRRAAGLPATTAARVPLYDAVAFVDAFVAVIVAIADAPGATRRLVVVMCNERERRRERATSGVTGRALGGTILLSGAPEQPD